MAKRRRKSGRRTFASYFKRKGKSRSGNRESVQSTMMGAAIYGAVRMPVAKYIDKWTSYVPYGIGDELALGVVSYIAAKKGSGLIKNVGKAGLVIETARITEQAINGFPKANGTPTAYSNNGTSAGGYAW